MPILGNMLRRTHNLFQLSRHKLLRIRHVAHSRRKGQIVIDAPNAAKPGPAGRYIVAAGWAWFSVLGTARTKGCFGGLKNAPLTMLCTHFAN